MRRIAVVLEDIYSEYSYSIILETSSYALSRIGRTAMISAGVVALRDRGWNCSDASSALAEQSVQ